MSNATSTQLQELYVAYFGRAADPTGLDYWTERGITTAAFAANMYAQPEFTSAYGSMSIESQVNQIYKNLFDREADVAGLTYWTQQINLGNLQLAEIANHLVWAAQNNSGSADDKSALKNRTDAAIAYTAKVKESTSSILAYQPLNNGLGTEDFSAGVNILEAVSFLSTIDKDTAFTAAAIATSVATITSNGIPEANAKTYTLTSSTDTLAGTNSKDVFQGVYVNEGADGTTVNAGDSLIGGDGVDTFNISITGFAKTSRKIEGINADVEKVLVSNFDTDPDQNIKHEINASLFDDVTTVGLSSANANGDTSVVNVKNIVDVELTNSSADFLVKHTDAATKGSSDSAKLTLSGSTGGFQEDAESTDGGLEILNVSSIGSTNSAIINSGQDSLETVNITGDQQLTSTVVSNVLKTVDASAFTGKLLLTTDEAVDLTIKGGSGDDTITFAGANFDKSDTVDGGAGTDTLVIKNAVANATVLQNVSNIETLKIDGVFDVAIAKDVSVMSFDLSNAGANTLTLSTGVTSAVTATIGESGADVVTNTANVSLTVKGTADALDTTTSIAGGTGTDVIELTADTENDGAINIQGHGVRAVDTITVIDAGDETTSGATKPSGKDINLTTGAYITALTIDGSALDAANKDTDNDGDIDNDDTSAEKLTVDGSSATAVLTITGGGAGDTITGGSKNDVIDGGGGDDEITLTAGGNDNVKGGAGNDKFIFGTTLTKDDVVDGGAGTDTVSVTTLTAANLTGITNVETLAFTGTATLSKDLSFDTVDLSDGNTQDKITFADGYTSATTVKFDKGDTAINNAKIALTVSGSAADFETGDGTVVTGSSSTKNDSLTITASGEDNADTVVTSGSITNVNSITVADNGDKQTGTIGTAGVAGSDFTINLGSYATALTIDASALDAAWDDNDDGKIDGSDTSDERLVIVGNASAALTVTGGAGADTVLASTKIDTFTTGAGDDIITMGASLTYEDTIDGGAGTDTLNVSSAITDVQFMNVSNVETLDLTTGAADQEINLATYFNASGISKVVLDGGNISQIKATGTTTGVTYELTTAAIVEDITAGLGDDLFLVDEPALLSNTDVINGGAGTDTIQIDNTHNGGFNNTISLVDVTNVEKITFKDADGGDTAGSENADPYKVTLDSDNGDYKDADSTDETDYTITVDASNITDTNDIITIDASNVADDDFILTATTGAGPDVIKGGGGADIITSGGGIDTITAGAGADTIDAGAGADLITGGTGIDTITGGAGNDDFLYTVANSESTLGKPDVITDFTTGSDEIRIAFTTDNGAAATTYDFTNKGAVPNVSEGIGKLSSIAGQYLLNTTTNTLILDSDGNGLLQSTDLATTLTGVSALADADVAFDIITGSGGGAGGDTVTTGNGADTITLSIAADAATTGKGDDKITIANSVVNTGAIDMGAGTDIIHADGDSGITGAVTGVEKITIKAGGSMTVDAANATTFNGVDGFEVVGTSAGAESFILAGVASPATGAASVADWSSIVFTNVVPHFVYDNAGDKFTGGSSAEIFEIPNDSVVQTLTGASKFAGGTGEDTIDVNTATNVNLAAGVITDVEVLDLIDDQDPTVSSAQATMFTKFVSAAGGSNELVTIAPDLDGSSNPLASAINTASATFTNVDINATLDHADDTILLGAGVDVLDIDAALVGDADTAVNGGGGTADIINLNTNGIVNLSASTVTGFEVLDHNKAAAGRITLNEATLSEITTATSTESQALQITVIGNGGVSALDLSLQTQTTGVGSYAIGYTVDNAADVIKGSTGGAAVDTFTIATGTTAFTGGASLNLVGGTGTDKLNITGTGVVDLTASTLATIEDLTLDTAAVSEITLTAAQKNDFSGTITADATDKVNITGMNGITITATSAIDKFVVGASDVFAAISSFAAGAGGDVMLFQRTVNKAASGATMVIATANSAMDSGNTGLLILDEDQSSVSRTAGGSNGMTAAEAKTHIMNGTLTGLLEDEKTIVGVTTDATNASPLDFYLLEVASGNETFETPVYLGSLAGITDVSAFTAANFLGFATS